ncbi:thiopurine S-methyltransferase [Alloalcanivorax mobilis]|uniref:thiopurine S-methyltransferase n=1 Tax=Alloalcanivorax mobilis TaxID=2019569 RepID=UPI000C77DFE6|nr:thiopurine S-methyltransferase [Alloalcanivorax mobilis]
MEGSFWKDKWQKHELGFHLPFVHPILKRSLPLFDLPDRARVFLPLCGKTLDMGYLLEQGYGVVGVELSELAVRELFQERNLVPEISDWAGGQCWRHADLTVFQGDFFALTAQSLGPVDLIYDRAALVALPPPMRERYAEALPGLTATAPQLLISFEYDQARMDGPPFSVPPAWIERAYGRAYHRQELSRKDVIAHQPRFQQAGLGRFEEVAWRLVRSDRVTVDASSRYGA